MSDINRFLNITKKAALGAVEASKPVNVCYGKVISSSPLKIQVEQKLILSKQQLSLSKNVTNHTKSITFDGKTQNATIHNALKLNDEVILIRMQGGQKYFVIDRIGG